MSARRLPGAAENQQQKRAGSPGHAQSARTLARHGRGMGTTARLARRGHGMSIRSLRSRGQSMGVRRLVLVVLVSGGWRGVSRLAPVAEGSRLAPVVADRVGRAWGAVI